MKETDYKNIQETIGYFFNDIRFLEQALRHSSYVNEHDMNRISCNERLEFLGDAVLELVSSEYLFTRYPRMPEGELTKLRARLVCEPALAYDAREFSLPEHLLLGKGEENTGGRMRDSVVSDACEALIGAIYLDGGLEKARSFILAHVLNDIENKKLFYDSKSALQEITQRDFETAPVYRIVDESGPAHDKIYRAQVEIGGESYGEGEGRTKKQAEQQASYHAILKLKTIIQKKQDKDVSEKY